MNMDENIKNNNNDNNNDILHLQSIGLATPKEFVGKNNRKCIYTEYIENNDVNIINNKINNNNNIQIDQTENILKISGTKDQVIYSTACEQRLHLSIKPPGHYAPILKAVFTNQLYQRAISV